MALRSGLAAQLGVAKEATWGTFVAPTRFFPLRSEGLEFSQERLDSEAIVAGRTTPSSDLWALGGRSVSGGIELDATAASQGILWEAALGNVSTSGTGPFTHTFTPGDLDGKSLSIQVGRPDLGGTVRPFSFTGCKVASLELSVETGSLASLSVEIIGRDVSTSETLGTPSFSATPQILTGHKTTVSIAGSSVNARSFTLSIENPLSDDRFRTADEFLLEPHLVGLREITAEVEVEFADLTQFQRFVNADVVQVQAVLTPHSGSGSLTITLNGRVDEGNVAVGGPEILTQTLSIKAMGTSDSSALTVVLVNADSSP